MNPRVSVIIPNYNHARYLPRRIESVLNQTFRDIEVILMDDCSPDNSRDVIADYAARDSRISVVLNEQNSGSTFKQWNKGIAIARGEFIWIAESDDYADSTFLATLIAKLDTDADIGLAYCDSWDVNEQNQIIDTRVQFYEELDPIMWTQDFVLPGEMLVNKFMFFRNIIPNASAVLIRRSILSRTGPADETFKVNGDWVFWAKILAVSKVAFISARLNYFRRHTNNVRSTTITNGTALLEHSRVLNMMATLGKPDSYFFNKMIDTLLYIWFDGLINHQIPVSKHRQIYINLSRVDQGFGKRFKYAFAQRMFPNKLSGLRQLIGDGFLYRFMRRRTTKH
ncbi:glycosyltransferase family 2 protein [Hymenobacter humi]|uniref:Glycosyltransferase family 2 protein n=1 Tax=Hymenobacter humi TaxID=1411620 RepID=A0ABW2UD21_9BACT